MTFLSQMLLEVALFVFLWFAFDLWRLSGKEARLTKLLEHKIAQFVPTNNIPYYFWAKPFFPSGVLDRKGFELVNSFLTVCFTKYLVEAK